MWVGQRGFVGGAQDDGTGLTNLGAREYDPSIGRFLSPDPLLDTTAPQTRNVYDSPVTLSDPSGCAPPTCVASGTPSGVRVRGPATLSATSPTARSNRSAR
ncbi:RHS repeat-associated core domain-containing protein [Streptomyces sp. NPDC004539]|uniref:RHS repeat-associated core domain-containing protein n=1 Tax=Streptomyces sp. NPDC004539 TaxID=3154280 RepID=UPI0033B6F669